MQYEQMHAVVTGACGGIGRELAQLLAARGATLYLIGRNAAELAALAEQLDRPDRIFWYANDLSQQSHIEALAHRLREHQQINVLVNNAGVNRLALFCQHSPEELDNMMRVNVTAAMHLTSSLLPLLQRQQQARIVNVGSMFGQLGFPGYVGYVASKFALRGFSEALHRELSDGPVSVGHFSARATNTSMNSPQAQKLNEALGNAVDEPAQVAEQLAHFLCSRRLHSKLPFREAVVARLNALVPGAVTRVIKRQLPLVKQHV